MKTAFETFNVRCEEVQDVDSLRELFSAAVKSLGYSGFDAYGFHQSSLEEPEREPNFFICDYGLEPLTAYIQGKWIMNDPVMLELGRCVSPFEYVAFLRAAKQTGSVRFQLGLLQLHGVERAWLFPMNTVSMVQGMSLYMLKGVADGERRFNETKDRLHLACIKFISAFHRIREVQLRESDAQIEASLPRLGDQEARCVYWVAQGKTNWEIAQIVEVSENTVRFHLKNAFRKLNVNSRSRAVVAAARHGLIDI